MPDYWELASIVARFLLYLGVLGSFGLVLVHIVFLRETRDMHVLIKRQALVLASLAFLSSGLSFSLKGAAMTGEASGLVDPGMLGLLWQTLAGDSLVIRNASLALVLFGIWISGIGLWIAAVGGIAVLWSFSRVGHVQDARSSWLALVQLLHLAGAAFWIGILSPLHKMAGNSDTLADAAMLGRHFGTIAAFIVPGLIIAGVVMAWHLLEGALSLFTTVFGLLIKISLVACMLGAAAANKLRFVPDLMNENRMAAVRLRRSIAVEWVAVCFVLLATAVLTT